MSLYSPKRTGQESRRLGLMLSVLYLSHVVTGSLVTRSYKKDMITLCFSVYNHSFRYTDWPGYIHLH